MRKWLIAIGFVLAMAPVVAGCGSSPTPPATEGRPMAPPPLVYGMAVVKTATPGSSSVITATPGVVATRTTSTAQPVRPSPTPGPGQNERAGVPRIDVAEAKAMADAGQAILVDVRSAATYEAQHIAGAISMPAAQVPGRYTELPTDRLVIFYCA